MAAKNSRNAALLIASTLVGPFVRINKTHGLKLAIPTALSDSTGHGQRFMSNTPGLQDFKVTITKWYDSASALLETISVNKLAYYFQLYYDFADSLNYYVGQGYLVQDEDNLDLGQTIDQGYTLALADADPNIIRNGVTIIA